MDIIIGMQVRHVLESQEGGAKVLLDECDVRLTKCLDVESSYRNFGSAKL